MSYDTHWGTQQELRFLKGMLLHPVTPRHKPLIERLERAKKALEGYLESVPRRRDWCRIDQDLAAREARKQLKFVEQDIARLQEPKPPAQLPASGPLEEDEDRADLEATRKLYESKGVAAFKPKEGE